MGGETTPGRAVVQSAGHAYELIGKLLKEEFTRAGAMQHLLLRYTRALLTQMAQTAVCNRHHSLDQQLCRRLSPSLDRFSGNELVMTRITVLDRAGLENALVSVLRRGQEGVRSFVARPDCFDGSASLASDRLKASKPIAPFVLIARPDIQTGELNTSFRSKPHELHIRRILRVLSRIRAELAGEF